MRKKALLSSVAMLLVVASVYEVQDLHAEAEMSYDDINETENEWLDKIDKDVLFCPVILTYGWH